MGTIPDTPARVSFFLISYSHTEVMGAGRAWKVTLSFERSRRYDYIVRSSLLLGHPRRIEDNAVPDRVVISAPVWHRLSTLNMIMIPKNYDACTILHPPMASFARPN